MTHKEYPDHRVNVVRSVQDWLEQAMTWLYTLVEKQSLNLGNHVICNRLLNSDQFPYQKMI